MIILSLLLGPTFAHLSFELSNFTFNFAFMFRSTYFFYHINFTKEFKRRLLMRIISFLVFGLSAGVARALS